MSLINKEKIYYFLIREESEKGIFICISELDILNKGEKYQEIQTIKYKKEENLDVIEINIKNKESPIRIDLEKNEVEEIKKFIDKKEAALIIMSHEGNILKALDITE